MKAVQRIGLISVPIMPILTFAVIPAKRIRRYSSHPKSRHHPEVIAPGRIHHDVVFERLKDRRQAGVV